MIDFSSSLLVAARAAALSSCRMRYVARQIKAGVTRSASNTHGRITDRAAAQKTAACKQAVGWALHLPQSAGSDD